MLTIYVVDFAINAGWCSARTEQTDFTRLMQKYSPVFVPKSDRRYFTDCKAATRFCLGYALLALIREYTHVDFLKASRMIAIGHLIGYGAGTLDLVSIIGPVLGDTQFKQLTVIAAFAFLAAIAITSWAVEERVLISAR